MVTRDEKGRFLPGYEADWEYNGARPKGSISLVTRLRRRLIDHPEEADDIIANLINMGRARELGAIKELFDRIDGKALETHKIEELPIKLVFVPANMLETAQDAITDTPEVKLIEGDTDATE